jgi:hypothetical protein
VHVRFSPISRHRQLPYRCQLRANSGHWASFRWQERHASSIGGVCQVSGGDASLFTQASLGDSRASKQTLGLLCAMPAFLSKLIWVVAIFQHVARRI